jgi:hypothetical protein
LGIVGYIKIQQAVIRMGNSIDIVRLYPKGHMELEVLIVTCDGFLAHECMERVIGCSSRIFYNTG